MKRILIFVLLIAIVPRGFAQNYIEHIDRINRLEANDFQYDICISPDKMYMAMASQSAIKIVDIQNFKIIKIIPVEFERIGLISFYKTSNEVLIAGGKKNGFSVEVYSWMEKKLIKKAITPGKGTYASSVAKSNNYLVCVGDNKQLYILNYNTLELIKTIEVKTHSKNIYNVTISNDETQIAFCDYNSRFDLKSSIYIYDFNGTLKYSHQFEGFIQGDCLNFSSKNELFVVETKNIASPKHSNTLFRIDPVLQNLTILNQSDVDQYSMNGAHALTYVTDNLLVYGGPDNQGESITLMYLNQNQSTKISYTDLNDSKTIGAINERGYTKYRSIEIAKDIYIIPVGYQNFNFVVDVKNRKSLGLIYHKGKQIAFVSSDGRFTGDNEAISNLQYREPRRVNIDLVSQIDQFYEPKLFSQLLTTDNYVTTASTAIPDLSNVLKLMPELKIISPDSISEQKVNTIAIKYTVKENGDGVKDVRFYVNGKLLNDDTRGFKTIGVNSCDISVVNGQNIIEAVAVSNSGYQSNSDRVIINYKGAESAANLYILAIGINQYRNTKYNLNYALADATSIADYIKLNSASIFKHIDVKLLTNQDATKVNIIDEFTRIAQQANESDVFMLYYAGHGVMSDGSANIPKDYFMVLTDVYQMYGNDDLLLQKGLSAAELREFSKKIKARKQVILLDACQSGGATETFAMRGASEEKAIIQLAQSAGVFLISSTSSDQVATEFADLNHGVFTYALLEGLKGAADGANKDGKVTMKELEAYLNDRIPELTQKYRGAMQFPNSWSKGMDFPLVVVSK